MRRDGNWSAIERLPERPGVAVMVGTGYWLDGVFYPSHRKEPAPMEVPRTSLLAKLLGGGR